jgi:hypothetical protein
MNPTLYARLREWRRNPYTFQHPPSLLVDRLEEAPGIEAVAVVAPVAVAVVAVAVKAVSCPAVPVAPAFPESVPGEPPGEAHPMAAAAETRRVVPLLILLALALLDGALATRDVLGTLRAIWWPERPAWLENPLDPLVASVQRVAPATAVLPTPRARSSWIKP